MVEADTNYTVNNIPEMFSSMGVGSEVRKLNILYCVNQVKCFAKLNIMESGYEDVKRSGLGCYPVCKEYFYFCLIFHI